MGETCVSCGEAMQEWQRDAHDVVSRNYGTVH